MAMRLDPDIRQVAETAQRRRREAAKRVKSGEIPHLNFIAADSCLHRAQENLGQIEAASSIEDSLQAIADAVNYGLAFIGKCAFDDEGAVEATH